MVGGLDEFHAAVRQERGEHVKGETSGPSVTKQVEDGIGRA